MTPSVYAVLSLIFYKFFNLLSNRPFYRHGGHFGFINLKHIMGFPGSKHAKCFRDGICHFSSQRCIRCKFIFLFKYYGRSTGREHKDFSKEEWVERWEIAKIFERSWYCYHRWYSQAQLNFKLRFIYCASRLHLQQCSTKEQEQAQIAVRRKEKLLIDEISLPFPEDLANWLAGSQHSPDTTMTDIETYMYFGNYHFIGFWFSGTMATCSVMIYSMPIGCCGFLGR